MNKKQRPVPRALLLDLDGVLIDTVALHAEAHRRAALAHGIRLTREELEAQRGMLPKAFYKMVLRERGEPLEKAGVLAERKEQEAAQMASLQPARAKPGAKEILELALAKGVKISVVSSASRESLERRLREASLWDPRLALVAMEDVARGKPAPDPYVEAIKRVQVEARSCIAVEDAQSGVLSSKAAGVYCVGLDERQEARLKEADEIVSDLWELARRLGWTATAAS